MWATSGGPPRRSRSAAMPSGRMSSRASQRSSPVGGTSHSSVSNGPDRAVRVEPRVELHRGERHVAVARGPPSVATSVSVDACEPPSVRYQYAAPLSVQYETLAPTVSMRRGSRCRARAVAEDRRPPVEALARVGTGDDRELGAKPVGTDSRSPCQPQRTPSVDRCRVRRHRDDLLVELVQRREHQRARLGDHHQRLHDRRTERPAHPVLHVRSRGGRQRELHVLVPERRRRPRARRPRHGERPERGPGDRRVFERARRQVESSIPTGARSEKTRIGSVLVRAHRGVQACGARARSGRTRPAPSHAVAAQSPRSSTPLIAAPAAEVHRSPRTLQHARAEPVPVPGVGDPHTVGPHRRGQAACGHVVDLPAHRLGHRCSLACVPGDRRAGPRTTRRCPPLRWPMTPAPSPERFDRPTVRRLDGATDEDPRDGRHRLHRWAARAAAGRAGPRGAVPHPSTRAARRGAVGRARARSCGATPSTGRRLDAAMDGHRRRLLPGPLDRHRRRRSQASDRRAAEQHRRRPRRRPASAASSTWAGSCPQGQVASPHLASRAEVGQIFLDGAGPRGRAAGRGDHRQRVGLVRDAALPDRAAAGDGHARSGCSSRVQPIAVRDVLALPRRRRSTWTRRPNRRFDIAGPDVLTYREMMQRYAAVAGLTHAGHHPGAGAVAVAVEPVGQRRDAGARRRIAQPLIESLRNDAVAREHDIEALMPGRPRAGSTRRCDLALDRIADAEVVTRWSGAEWPGAPSDPMPTDPDWSGGTVYRDERSTAVDADRRAICGGPSRASAATAAGTRSRWPGRCAACWTGWSAASGCGGAGATPTRCSSATPSTSGGSRRSSATDCCACGPRCGCPARPGSSSRSPPSTARPGGSDDGPTDRGPVGTGRPGRSCTSVRCSSRVGCSGRLYWLSISPFHGIVFGSMIANLAPRPPAGTAPVRAPRHLTEGIGR